jgi:hypothetical protein
MGDVFALKWRYARAAAESVGRRHYPALRSARPLAVSARSSSGRCQLRTGSPMVGQA